MHIPWESLQLFLAVAESGSLTRAAARLRVTQPTVSRRLADLEAALSEPLFVRTVEGTALTPFAERLLAPARRMAECAGEVERAAEQTDAAPSGVVRITAPPGVAWEVLVPLAAELRVKLPDVRLEVLARVEYLDLGRREADLALRTQAPAQRDLVSVASLDHAVAAFASADYVASLPRGYGMTDVAWIGWTPELGHLPPNPELAKLMPGFRPAFAADDFLVQLRAAHRGLGAIFLGRVRHRFQEEQLLQELTLDLPPLARSLHLVCARSALGVPRIRAVADLLAKELAAARPRASLPRKQRRVSRAGIVRAGRGA